MSSRSSVPPTAPPRPSSCCRSRRPACPGWRRSHQPARAGRHRDRRRERLLRPSDRRGRAPDGAEVVEVEAELGEHVPNARLLAALEEHPGARLLAVVHAETSTGSRHPLAELGEAMRDSDTLLLVDCVTSLAGIELEFDTWGIDYAVFLHAEVSWSAPRHVPSRGLRACDAPDPLPQDAGAVLLRPAALEQYSKSPIVYHRAARSSTSTRSRRSARGDARGSRGALGRHAAAGAHLQSAIRERGWNLLADPITSSPS